MSGITTGDIDLAERLAREAGKLLLDLRTKSALTSRALGDEGDAVANCFLIGELQRLRPDDGLLSEESKDTSGRLNRSRVWIVDPVDGTREYGEGRADWAVHVGLAVVGNAAGGAVAMPDLDGGVTLRSDRAVERAAYDGPPRIVVSRSRPAEEADLVAQALGGTLVPMGSAGAKAIAVVRGNADAYIHSGGQFEWDSCAPVAVASGNGLHCSRLDGSPLRYNRADPYLPDLLICRTELAGAILRALARPA